MCKNNYRYFNVLRRLFCFASPPLPYLCTTVPSRRGPPTRNADEDPSRIDAWAGAGATTRGRGKASPCRRRAALVTAGESAGNARGMRCSRHSRSRLPHLPHRLLARSGSRRSYSLPPPPYPPEHSSAASWNPGGRARNGAGVREA